MHDSRDRQLNLAPGLRHPATEPKDIWCGQIAEYKWLGWWVINPL
jgi:hypothetical protein